LRQEGFAVYSVAVTAPTHDLSKLRLDRNAPAAQRPRRPWLWVVLGAVLLVALFLASQVLWSTVPVQVALVTSMDPQGGGGGEATAGATAVTANGYVVARTRAAVAAKIPGRLATLDVSEGSFVRKGAVIARLENADYAAAAEEARANVATAVAQRIEAQAERDQARRDLDRLLRIRAERAELTSPQDIENADNRFKQADARANAASARVDAAEASLRFAEATLESLVIRAPFTGTVLRKEAEVGEVVAPSVGGGLTRGAVVTMADLQTLEVEVDVNEAYIGRVNHDQDARITLDAYPDTGFRGVVRQVVPTADRQRATVQVKVTITDRDRRILPEMGARVDFLAPRVAEPATGTQGSAPASAPQRFRVPAEAVRGGDGSTVVWLVRNGRLERREVDAGPVSGGFREIRRGLAGGEQVLMSGVETPTDGMRVKVQQP
jgi:RND family efflux transporter MFP subunit